MAATMGADGLIQFTPDSQESVSFYEFGHGAFGEPRSAVNAHELIDYLGVFLSPHDYYSPPISLRGLLQLMRANPHHGALPSFKANLLCKYMEDNRAISRRDLKQAGIDYCAMGNAYFQAITNGFGQVIQVKHLPAVSMRVKADGHYCMLLQDGKRLDFKEGEVIHLKDYEPSQQVYGVPYWFGAVQSILLGEDARLFQRRFFLNGAHMGNLFATSGLTPKEEKTLKEKLESSKGIGNFRSAHVGMPTGDVDKVIKVIPIGEFGNKVEITKYANLSASDVLEAWRIRPELAGMMPEGTGSSGDLGKIMELNYEYEVIPFQQDFQEINAYLPARLQLKFKEWKRPDLPK
jgi:PBSX family phage portal protein